MNIRNVITILIVSFITAFSVLNLDLVFSRFQVNKIYDNINTKNTAFAGDTYLFPLSQEKVMSASTHTVISSSSPILPASVAGVNTAIAGQAILEVPSLGIKAPIVYEPSTNDDIILKSLEKGIVHYSETPRPGEPGTAIILGHSSHYPWYKGNYGKIFASLPNLKSGDIIKVTIDSQVLTYRVSKSLIFSPDTDNDYELRELESTIGSSIVLMTCWPVGTNAKRIAVRANLQ